MTIVIIMTLTIPIITYNYKITIVISINVVYPKSNRFYKPFPDGWFIVVLATLSVYAGFLN